MKVICKDCGKEFELSQGEISFYRKKGLSPPKRCEECRKANKVSKTADPKLNTEFNITDKKLASKQKKIISILAFAVVVLAGALGINLFGSDEAGTEPVYTESQVQSSRETSVSDSREYSQPEEEPQTEEPEEYVVSYSGKDYYTQKYYFRNSKLLSDHYKKHGIEMGFTSKEEYEAAASEVITNRKALHKYEAEDGDSVYFLENTGEIVFLSTDGYIRTYFYATKDYFDRQ